MFFDNWFGLLRAVVVGTLAYAGLVLFLRASGKRTLSKMNAFDLVVTVALGSTLATVLLTEKVALLEGLTGLGVLILLQLAVSRLSVHSSAVRRLVRAEPTLLFFRGEVLRGALAGQRVTEAEVLQAVRSAGLAGLEEVEAVVLESDGTFSVVSRGSGSGSALRDVPGVAGSGEAATPSAGTANATRSPGGGRARAHPPDHPLPNSSGTVPDGDLRRPSPVPRSPHMNRLLLGIVSAGAIALAGCEKSSTTAPSTNPNKPGDTRKLSVTAPTEQNVTQNGTEKFTVRIDRDNFAGPVQIEIRNLPTGVEVVTPDMTIPADKSSLEVSVKAKPDAPVVNDHKVQVVARAKDQPDMKETIATFDMDVKAK